MSEPNATKPRCFMIQPFSEPYNQRYQNVYKPAIEAAGLEPYRVDEHYNPKKLIIKSIEDEIRNSAVCVADISENNPNVWYEFGFADGQGIPVVLICDEQKRSKLPFDVNQRNTYFYDANTDEGREQAQQEITKRLNIALEKSTQATPPQPTADVQPQTAPQQTNETDILHTDENIRNAQLGILKILYYDIRNEPRLGWEKHLRKTLVQQGYTEYDVTDGLEFLEHRKMIIGTDEYDEIPHYTLTDTGKIFCMNHTQEIQNAEPNNDFETDIPF